DHEVIRTTAARPRSLHVQDDLAVRGRAADRILDTAAGHVGNRCDRVVERRAHRGLARPRDAAEPGRAATTIDGALGAAVVDPGAALARVRRRAQLRIRLWHACRRVVVRVRTGRRDRAARRPGDEHEPEREEPTEARWALASQPRSLA